MFKYDEKYDRPMNEYNPKDWDNHPWENMDDWVKQNPWMKDWFDEEVKTVAICINFPSGVPFKDLEERRNRRLNHRFKERQNLELFRELMNERPYKIKGLVEK